MNVISSSKQTDNQILYAGVSSTTNVKRMPFNRGAFLNQDPALVPRKTTQMKHQILDEDEVEQADIN